MRRRHLALLCATLLGAACVAPEYDTARGDRDASPGTGGVAGVGGEGTGGATGGVAGATGGAAGTAGGEPGVAGAGGVGGEGAGGVAGVGGEGTGGAAGGVAGVGGEGVGGVAGGAGGATGGAGGATGGTGGTTGGTGGATGGTGGATGGTGGATGGTGGATGGTGGATGGTGGATNCGNGVLEGDEVCDGNPGRDCPSLGYPAGVLSCASGCRSYDVSGCKNLFFSEYVEGTGSDHAVEIYNASGHDVSLMGCSVMKFNLGGTIDQLALTDTLAAGDVFVACGTGFSDPSRCDVVSSEPALAFSGRESLVLSCGGTWLDVIGQIGTDPGTGFGTPPTSTADSTLRRRCDVTGGDGMASDAFDPTVQWSGVPAGSIAGLGTHCEVPLAAIGYCVLQWPTAPVTISSSGAAELVFGRLYVVGQTDLSGLVDTHAKLIAELGFGRTTDLADFTWMLARPNLGEMNNDEYVANVSGPLALGDYRTAYRFSVDGGVTWLDCGLVGVTPTAPFSPSDEGGLTVTP